LLVDEGDGRRLDAHLRPVRTHQLLLQEGGVPGVPGVPVNPPAAAVPAAGAHKLLDGSADDLLPRVGPEKFHPGAVDEDDLPAGVDEDGVRGEFDQAVVPLLALAQRARRPRALDGVADRPPEQRGVKTPLDEVVGRPRPHRLGVHLVAALTREQDHRRAAAFAARLAQQVEPAPLAEAVVQQVDVVLAPADRPARLLVGGDPVEAERAAAEFGQPVARHHVVVLVVVDEQDSDRQRVHLRGRLPRRAVPRSRTSTCPGSS
jgi:hypothetical protein